MEAIKVEGLVVEQCVLLVVILLPILIECNQENVPDQGPLSLRESAFSNKETITSTSGGGLSVLFLRVQLQQ